MTVLTNYYLYFRKEAIEVANISDEGKRTEMFEELESDKLLISQLTELASKYTKITDFLDNIALDATTPSEEEELLTLSTIHSAKGMEWKTVFLMDCVDGVFPKYNEACRGNDDYYEELRCFYVALTRAKADLFLLCPEVLQVNGKFVEGIPAHFLRESQENHLLQEENCEMSKQKVYLYVPYSEKDNAKKCGAKWDQEKKQWYYFSDGTNDLSFQKWAG